MRTPSPGRPHPRADPHLEVKHEPRPRAAIPEPPGWATPPSCEAHRGGRIVVRGSVAGRYVDLDGEQDPVGRETGIGAVAGATAGLALGPSAVAIGLVGGAIFGGSIEARRAAVARRVPPFDAIREQCPRAPRRSWWSPMPSALQRWARP